MQPAVSKQTGTAASARAEVDKAIASAAGPNAADRARPFVAAIEAHPEWLAEHIAELRPGEAAAVLVTAKHSRFVGSDGRIREHLSASAADRLRGIAKPDVDLDRAATLADGLSRFRASAEDELARVFGERPEPPLPGADGGSGDR